MLLRSNFVLGVGFVLGGLLSNSCAHATVRVLTYNVEDPIFAIIGTYTNTVSEKRDSADVLTDLHVAVEIMGIPLFHEEATREEWWQHKRLVAFQGSTDDNGT